MIFHYKNIVMIQIKRMEILIHNKFNLCVDHLDIVR